MFPQLAKRRPQYWLRAAAVREGIQWAGRQHEDYVVDWLQLCA